MVLWTGSICRNDAYSGPWSNSSTKACTRDCRGGDQCSCLFLLTRIIIERPLQHLIRIVEALGAGEFPELPPRKRRDQIGVLYAAIARFRETLLHLNRVEQRKAEDHQRIRDLVGTMTQTIQG